MFRVSETPLIRLSTPIRQIAMTIDHKDTNERGILRVTITLNNGKREIHRHVTPDIYALTRMVEKCEIKAFSVSLEPL